MRDAADALEEFYTRKLTLAASGKSGAKREAWETCANSPSGTCKLGRSIQIWEWGPEFGLQIIENTEGYEAGAMVLFLH
jgi:hypothetical protein